MNTAAHGSRVTSSGNLNLRQNAVSPEGVPLVPATEPVMAVCIIVKDELEWIGAAVNSVRPYVAEINVYDTGSTDGTLELFQGMAAEPRTPIRVGRGEWRRDFSWAREQSFAMASPGTDWILWIDADDVVLGAENLWPYLARPRRGH